MYPVSHETCALKIKLTEPAPNDSWTGKKSDHGCPGCQATGQGSGSHTQLPSGMCKLIVLSL